MNYEEAVAYFLDIPKFARSKHMPEDLQVFLDVLGNPEMKMKLIHVAGTNGKGSVCAFMTSILMAADKHVATFVSPHLIHVNERFLIDGVIADDSRFLRAFHKVYDTVKGLEKQKAHPTFFEFAFLIFMVIAMENQAEYAVLETGMGGRLDATNVIRHPMVTLITSIGRDHVEYLGDTIEAIAGEKAGILKPGTPVVYDGNNGAAAFVIENRAEELRCKTYSVSSSACSIVDMASGHTMAELKTRNHGILPIAIPFMAEYQAVNVALAVNALELILTESQLTSQMIISGIRTTVWPGRMEQVRDGVFLDGAHNEDGIKAFVKSASRILKNTEGRAYVLFAVVSDKDYNQMVKTICDQVSFDAIFLTQIHSGRALDVKQLEQAAVQWTSKPVYECETVREAVTQVLKLKQPGDTVFCVGSLYLIGEIKEFLKEDNE